MAGTGRIYWHASNPANRASILVNGLAPHRPFWGNWGLGARWGRIVLASGLVCTIGPIALQSSMLASIIYEALGAVCLLGMLILACQPRGIYLWRDRQHAYTSENLDLWQVQYNGPLKRDRILRRKAIAATNHIPPSALQLARHGR